MDELLEAGHGRASARLAIRLALGVHVRDPAVEDEAERAPFGPRLGRKVADELAVGGQTLALAALQPALGRQVRVGDHEVLAHGVRADGLEQEALAGAVAADQKAKRGPAVGDEVEVGQKSADLNLAAHGDIGQADARHDAALQGVQDDGGHAPGHARGR